jgi:hypothetical protein
MPKRKSTTQRSKSNKRRKYADSSDAEVPAPEDLWEAEGILDERHIRGKLQYLVQWKGRDPQTGKEYEPTWEPRENCTEALVVDWARQRSQQPDSSAGGSAESSGAKRRQKKLSKPPRSSRQSRVVQSSPEPSTAHTTSVLSGPSTPAVGYPTLAFASSAVTTPVDAPPPPERPSLRVQVPRGDGFDPNEYERFSQLAPSQPPFTESRTQGADFESSQVSAAVSGYSSSGIVPDSQSSVGEGSFVPATQQTTGTTQESSPVHESQEDVTEDSVCAHHSCTRPKLFADDTSQGLLEIVQQATSRAPSPARSIPETVDETSAESQSQRRPVDAHDPIEVLDTSEAIDNSSELVTQQAQSSSSKNAQPQSGASLVAHGEGQQEDESVPSPEQVAPPTGLAQVSPELSSSRNHTPSRLESRETQHESNNTQHQSEELTAAQAEIQQQDEAPTSQEQVLSFSSGQAVPQPVEVGPSQDIFQPQEQQERQDLHRSPPTLDSVTNPTVDGVVDEHQHLLDSQPPATNSELVLTEKPRAIDQEGESIAKEPSAGDLDISSISGNVQSTASQDIAEASLAEHSVLDQSAQFPFHSQHPLHNTLDAAQPLASHLSQENIQSSIVTNTPAVDCESRSQTERPGAVPIEDSAASLIQAFSYNAPENSQSTKVLVVSSTQTEDQSLFEEYLNPEFTRSQSPTVAQVQAETAVQRRDFALDSQTPLSVTQSFSYREQNAQVVLPNNDIGTQEDAIESVRPSVEEADVTGRSTPDSRHDSSQDSPDRQLSPARQSPSPIVHPPNYSFDTLDSNAPPRPKTPVPTSSLSIMATQDSGKELARQLQEQIAQRQAEKPFTPRRRLPRSNMTPAASTQTPAATPAQVTSSRNLLQTGASPSVAATEGTRSPSTVPDRVPAPQAPTSLRAIALTQASQAPTEETQKETAADVSVNEPIKVVQAPVTTVPAIVTTGPTVPEVLSSDNEELSDATDDDDASLLNDDLQLGIEEHIVPLFIEGRQGDQYTAHIKQNEKLLQTFMKDPQNTKGLAEIEEVLSYLRALENHFDMVYQEADLAVGDDMADFSLHFGIENSIKFKFLHGLFHDMREQEKHVVLVTQDDSNRLYNIIRTFCAASLFQYNMPTRGHQADPTRVEGNLSVTIFPSTASPVIRPADVIICLDGVQDATQIRQKNWATNPDLNVVPILHLVISRTVGHIERYLSSSLGKRERVHTILACLAHMLGALGKPIDEDMLRTPVASGHVAEWLRSSEQDRGEWPLGSIGSVKDVIEYQTQMSQVSAASPVPERSKRPHDDEELDPAKRMRLTPQPHDNSGSSSNENEVTRISDSMPGTAADDAPTLRAQLARIEEAFEKERSMRKVDQARFREHESTWCKQQTVHEDLTREYRLLLSSKQALEEKVDSTSKNNETLRERLATRTTEIRTLTEQLDEQRNIHLLSEDAKIIEITKLRKDITEANAEKERAVKSAKSAEATLEYTKEQYRQAQGAATNSAVTIADLEAQVAKLSRAASGEHAKLKSLHLGRQHEALATQVKSLRAENFIVRQTLKLKEEELARAKLSGGRMGVGTRATSATPQPNKTRSRAASPMRLSNLRNG